MPGLACNFDSNCRKTCAGGIDVGKACNFNSDCRKTCAGGIDVGKACNFNSDCRKTCAGGSNARTGLQLQLGLPRLLLPEHLLPEHLLSRHLLPGYDLHLSSLAERSFRRGGACPRPESFRAGTSPAPLLLGQDPFACVPPRPSGRGDGAASQGRTLALRSPQIRLPVPPLPGSPRAPRPAGGLRRASRRLRRGSAAPLGPSRSRGG